MSNKTYFENLVGQENNCNKLSFLIDAQRKAGFMPNILFSSCRGSGKTLIATEVARNLVNIETGRVKPLIAINSAELKSVSSFINDLAIPHLIAAPITLFLDEIHALVKPLQIAFLTILANNKEKINYYRHDGVPIEFNFNKLTVLAATTNLEKLSPSLQDRFDLVGMERYKQKDLITILKQNASKISFNEDVCLKMVTVLRGNPRKAVQIADKVLLYCKNKSQSTFNIDDWDKLRKVLNINVLGLLEQEVEELSILINGPATLTHLAAKMRIDSTTVRRNVETYLLERNLIKIDNKRYITAEGKVILTEINKTI